MAFPLFAQGAFTASPNDTPETIAQKRAYIAAMMPRFGSAKYIGEGIGQLATGVVIGRQNKKLNEAEGAGRKSAEEQFNRLFGTANSAQSPDVQGPLSVLGMTPAEPGPPIKAADPSNPEAIASDAMTALGKGATPEGIKAGLVARGMPEHIADGFVMNFQDESGFNPGINEVAPLVPGSRGGFGLAQWTGPRRKALEAFAAERGMPVSDPGVQMDFLMTELQGPEAAAWAKISGTQNAGEAGAAIVNSFLRPAEEHRRAREAEYLGGAGMPSGGAAPAPTSAPEIPINELYMALQNPWLSEEQKGLITSMIGEQQQASDPLRQLELRKAELELPKDPASSAPAAFTSLDMQAKAAGLQPGTPEYEAFMLNGGGSGTPAAFVALDMQAKAAGFEPGTPEYQEFMATRGAGLAAAATEKGKAKAEAEIAAPADIVVADRTLQYIDEVRNHPGKSQGTGLSSYGNWIPGTSGKDFQNRVDQLKSGAFLSAIDEMRGMGSLSNAEGQTATAAITRMDTATSEEEFNAALDDYEAIVRLGRDRAAKRIKAPDDASAESGADGWTTLPNGVKVRVKQ